MKKERLNREKNKKHKEKKKNSQKTVLTEVLNFYKRLLNRVKGEKL